MSIWSEIEGSVTFHEKDHISIYKCFKEVVDDHYGLECLFSFTEPNTKWNDNVTSYFRVAIDTDVYNLSDILRSIETTIRRKYPKYFRMDIGIRARLVM